MHLRVRHDYTRIERSVGRINVVHIRLAMADGDEVRRLRSGGNNWYKIFNLVDKAEDANVALAACSLFQMKGGVNSDFMI